MIKVCERCGKEFKSRHASRRFCSKACGTATTNNVLAAMKKFQEAKVSAVCSHCGKEFVKVRPFQKCCSDECRRHAENLRRRNERKAKAAKRVATCAVCGKEFTPAHGAHRCCSAECTRTRKNDFNRRLRAELHAKIMTENPPKAEVRKCEQCGKEFVVGRMKQQRFCSYLCNKRAYRIKCGIEPRRLRSGGSTAFERADLRRQKLMQEVIDAQRGPIEELWAKSQKWTKEQRDFAKARYLKIHFGK